MFLSKEAGSKPDKKPKIYGVFSSLSILLSRDKLGELLVVSGKISSLELKSALAVQKSNKRPLGEILVAQGLVTPLQLRMVLAGQSGLRIFAGVCVCFTALSAASKRSYADYINDIPAMISVVEASAGHAFQDMREPPALFGASEKRSENMKSFTKWINMFDKFEATIKSETSQKIISEMRKELATYKSDSIYDMAVKVNEMMNRKQYIGDDKNWGKSDYWATPVEFMLRGGDCEDYAIAKYFGLRALGVPESRLRIAIVQDEKKNIPHAILVVYAEAGPVILDNQSDYVLSDSRISHYKPIYSINRQAWWLHTKPEATVVASAAR